MKIKKIQPHPLHPPNSPVSWYIWSAKSERKSLNFQRLKDDNACRSWGGMLIGPLDPYQDVKKIILLVNSAAFFFRLSLAKYHRYYVITFSFLWSDAFQFGLYFTTEKKIKEKFKTRKKIPPENSTVAIMTTKLRYDYEFYHFIRRKFYATWNKVKLKLNTIWWETSRRL